MPFVVSLYLTAGIRMKPNPKGTFSFNNIVITAKPIIVVDVVLLLDPSLIHRAESETISIR